MRASCALRVARHFEILRPINSRSAINLRPPRRHPIHQRHRLGRDYEIPLKLSSINRLTNSRSAVRGSYPPAGICTAVSSNGHSYRDRRIVEGRTNVIEYGLVVLPRHPEHLAPKSEVNPLNLELIAHCQ